MRRAFVMMTAAVLCAAPAQAQGWRWLEKLSGPGAFTGYEFNLKLVCGYEEVQTPGMTVLVGVSTPCLSKRPVKPKTVEPEPVKPQKPAQPPPGESPYADKQDPDPIGSLIPHGKNTSLDLAKRRYALGVGVSYLRGASDLDYGQADERVDRTVQLWAFETFYDRRIKGRTDFGVALGANLFVMPDADAFVRWSLEPRFTFKLFDLRKRNLYTGTASLRLGVLMLFGEFLAQDFGAIPGSYSSGDAVEFGPSVRFVLDFDRNPLSR